MSELPKYYFAKCNLDLMQDKREPNLYPDKYVEMVRVDHVNSLLKKAYHRSLADFEASQSRKPVGELDKQADRIAMEDAAVMASHVISKWDSPGILCIEADPKFEAGWDACLAHYALSTESKGGGCE